MRTCVALSVAVIALTASCGPAPRPAGPGAVPGASVAALDAGRPAPVSPPTTTPTTTPGPTPTTAPAPGPSTATVPAVIGTGYVDAVLAVLDHVYSDAVRSLRASHRVTPAVIRDAAFIFAPRLVGSEVGDFALALHDGELRDIRRRPGDRHTRVVRLISASRTCIFARVVTDESAVAVRPVPPPYAAYVGLYTAARGRPVGGINPTPWMDFFDITTTGPSLVADPCG